MHVVVYSPLRKLTIAPQRSNLYRKIEICITGKQHMDEMLKLLSRFRNCRNFI